MTEYPDTIVKQVAFLHERIDEIEAVAVEAVEMIEDIGDDVSDDASLEAIRQETFEGTEFVWLDASPAFIFAQCDAQREIIAAALASYSGEPYGHNAEESMRSAVLASLAVAYCDHPDYDPAWSEEL